MWADLQQEDLRRAILKSTINRSNKTVKSEKEEENATLAFKGPGQRQGRRRRRTCQRSSASDVVSLVTTVRSVLSRRRTNKRSRIRRNIN